MNFKGGKLNRREMLGAGSLAIGSTAIPGGLSLTTNAKTIQEARPDVFLASDSAMESPGAFSIRLARLVQRYDDVEDSYRAGGAVEQLESAFAALLGKEACTFLPTGSLANHLAVKVLAGGNPRALCMHDSHIYRDELDSVSTLGEVALRAFEPGRVYPGADELDAAFALAERGPRPVRVGAVTLESPVRRLTGQMVPTEELQRICAIAHSRGAQVHLDGARLLLAPPDVDIPDYVAPVDTVYVSLYKYLGAPFGAVLAGSAANVEAVRAESSIYGAGIYQGWVAALPALDALADFREKWARAFAHGESFFARLAEQGMVRREPIGPMISNDHLLDLDEEQAAMIAGRAARTGVYMRRWSNDGLPIQVNLSILERSVDELADLFTS